MTSHETKSAGGQPWRIWRADDLRPMPWRNGGGVTYEVAAEPEGSTLDDFRWRISIADVGAAGPFSAFAGVDRVIVLIGGNSMVLTVDGDVRELTPLQPVTFRGESETACALPAGPTKDLNLMTRRAQVRGALEVIELDGQDARSLSAASPLVLVALRGQVNAGHSSAGAVTLGPLDGLVSYDSADTTVAGRGAVAAIRLGNLG